MLLVTELTLAEQEWQSAEIVETTKEILWHPLCYACSSRSSEDVCQGSSC